MLSNLIRRYQDRRRPFKCPGACSQFVLQDLQEHGMLHAMWAWFNRCRDFRGLSVALKLPLIALGCLMIALGADMFGDAATSATGECMDFGCEGESDFCGSQDDWCNTGG